MAIRPNTKQVSLVPETGFTGTMTAHTLELVPSEPVPLGKLEQRLAEALELRHESDDGSEQQVERVWFDTFDWRLHGAKTVLLSETTSGRTIVSWRPRPDAAGRPRASLPLADMPRFVWDLPASRLRDELAPIIAMRALLPRAKVTTNIIALARRDGEGKIVVRVVLEESRLAMGRRKRSLGTRVRVLPLKGYHKAYRRMCKQLADGHGLQPAEGDLFAAALAAANETPRVYTPRIEIALEPAMRTDDVTKRILRRLVEVMDANLDGMCRDVDSEFLHDFRVSVRRTRSALARIRHVFPAPTVSRFKQEFRWLGQVTGPTRDMDVYLLKFPGYRAALPATTQPHLDPLRDFLVERQAVAHKALAAALDTPRFTKLATGWRTFVEAAVPQRSSLRNAQRPVGEVAEEEIWRAYRRAIREGSAITDQSPPDDLHELRKTCKKLRYLMEFFRSLFPAEAIKMTIAELKALQQNLGDLQDLEVQSTSLERFAVEMEDVSRETMMAMGALVQQLRQRQVLEREKFTATFQRFRRPANRKLARKLFRRGKGGK